MKKKSSGIVITWIITLITSSSFLSRPSGMFYDKYLVVDIYESENVLLFFSGQGSPYTFVERYVSGFYGGAQLFMDSDVNPSISMAFCDGGTSTDYVCAFNIPEWADDNSDNEIDVIEMEAYLAAIEHNDPSTIYFRSSQ